MRGSKFVHARGHGRFGPIQDLADFPGQAVGLVDALDLLVAEPGAQQPAELAEAIEPLVVHLDDEDAVEAGEHLRTFMQKEDILLVKSSQNTLFLETTVEMLMAHPEDADDFLCRRGAFWDAKRSEAML